MESTYLFSIVLPFTTEIKFNPEIEFSHWISMPLFHPQTLLHAQREVYGAFIYNQVQFFFESSVWVFYAFINIFTAYSRCVMAPILTTTRPLTGQITGYWRSGNQLAFRWILCHSLGWLRQAFQLSTTAWYIPVRGLSHSDVATKVQFSKLPI